MLLKHLLYHFCEIGGFEVTQTIVNCNLKKIINMTYVVSRHLSKFLLQTEDTELAPG
jgi:hypothetical protein